VNWTRPSPLSVSGRLLCISGTHGCGKTILASSIIEDLQNKQLQIIFYYFSGKSARLKTLDGIVRAFLWQLLDGTTDQRSLGLLNSLVLKGPPVLIDMIHALKEAAALITTPVYCVIDGVDEYIDESNDTIEKLLQLLFGLLNANANFRVVLLGRQHALQLHVLEATIGAKPEMIEICSDLVNQDISAFIDAGIAARVNSDLLRLPGLRDSISKMLQEKSDGMFLWVELMINDLSKSDSQFEVRERLRNPPRSLEEIYRRLFLRLVKRLDKFQLNLARKLLAFTIISCRTLEVNELQYALALDSGSSTFREHLLLHPGQRILDVCGDFINIKDDFVQLIHFSIQEFLTRPEDEWQHSDDRDIICFRVDLEPTHRSLGSACVDYLSMCEFGFPLSDTDALPKLAKDQPFLRYASRHAISHLSQAGPLCSATARKIRDFLGSENYAPWIEYLAMLVLGERSLAMLDDEFERFSSQLDIGEYKLEAFENDIRMHMNQELERRIRTFGKHDPRTEQWQSFLQIISLRDIDEDTDHNLADQTPPLLSTDESTLSHISNAIIHNPTLPLHRQIDVLLRLGTHLQRVKVLTDPLKMLFRIILQKSHAIPVYVLLVVADFYYRLDKWEEALEVYRAAFAKVEGQETQLKFVILYYIGKSLSKQGHYKEAESIHRRCLELRERVLGEDHEDTLRCINQLASVLRKQGKYVDAEVLLRRCLKLGERVLGEEHKDTLISIYMLACVLHEQGKYVDAEAFFRQCLKLRERVLGKEHKDTLWSIHSLGHVLYEQGKYVDAEVLLRRCLKLWERVLGEEHKDTLTSIYMLARILHEQGKYVDAEAFFRQCLKFRERVLGKEHDDTLSSKYWLARMLGEQGRYKEAEIVYQRTLDGFERTLGNGHKSTLFSAHWLADSLYQLGKVQEAEAMYRRTIQGMEKLFGKEHPYTLLAIKGLAEALDYQEEYEAAEEMHPRAVEDGQC
jgi:tetratricopeptide (TPR) repeat protein